MDAAHRRRQAADDLLRRVGGGGSAPDSQVVRDGAALLVRAGPVLVRARDADPLSWVVARREVDVARALAGVGVPVTPLVEPDDQPWELDGVVLTAWRWSDATGSASPADLGGLARTLRHRTAAVASTVAPFDPLGAIRDAVGHLPVDDPEAAFVRRRAVDLSGAWERAVADDPLGRSIVHGDLHAGNVVVGDGGPLLTDLELAGAGPASYDAAPSVVAVGRYGSDPAGLHDFLAAFGGSAADPRGWPGFATHVAVYELWVTAWAVGVRGLDPTWAQEASRRVETLRDGAPHRWTLR